MKAVSSVICMAYHGKQSNISMTSKIVEVWNKMFLEIVNKHAPLKSRCIKRKYQPDWLTPQILNCIKKRDKFKSSGKMDEY